VISISGWQTLACPTRQSAMKHFIMAVPRVSELRSP
jgi:hypothetical protein